MTELCSKIPSARHRLIWLVLAGLCYVGSANGAPFSISDARAQGSERSLTLQTNISPATDDLGKSISFFAVAVVPSGSGSVLYAKSTSGWTALVGNTAPSLVGRVQAQSVHTLNLAQGEDARGLSGTMVYAGYGLDDTGDASALTDMLRSARYRLVYTFGANTAGSDWSLQATTEAGLKAYFQEALGPAGKSYFTTPWAMGVVLTPGVSTTGAVVLAGAPVSVSGTTLQESGVDEADLVKTNGVTVFSLAKAVAKDPASGLLQRLAFNANAPDAAFAPGDSFKLPFSTGVRGTGLYLDTARHQVAVLGEAVSRWGVYDGWFSPQAWTQGATEVALVDTSSPTDMATRRILRINAGFVGSRRLGSTLYLVLRSYAQLPGLDPWWPTEKLKANQTILDTLTVAAVLPTLSIDGGMAQALLDASACFTQPKNAVKSGDIITVMAIDLASSTHRHAARCFTGGTEAFYMSDQSLYLATTRSAYTYNGSFPVYAGQSSTDIHKFSLNGLDMTYKGSGNVVGHLGFDQNRKSFRMGEHQGALRVITQSATNWGGWLPVPVGGSTPTVESPGHLSILQENNGSLVLTGELPNARRPAPLGKPGEQLYASRFLGARGFLVTYRLTDPLYVLNLSDPADPYIAGELQVSGYSDYLFPLSETLLLGVGKEAISDTGSGDGRFAWYQGVKLSLIDLTDPARPFEAARSIIGRRGTDATVLRNHHGIAIATSGNKVRVGLPVNLHNTAPQPSTGAAMDYFRYTRTELQKFDIDLGLQSLTARTALPSGILGERDISNDRSILWNNQVHYYQNGVWRSGTW